MPIVNGYCTLAEAKAWADIGDALDDAKIELAINAASRAIDEHCGRHFYAESQTRTYTAEFDDLLWVSDLLSISALATDADGDGTYETTWTAQDFRLEPSNAALDGRPFTRICAVPRSMRRFPIGIPSGVSVSGSFGFAAEAPDTVKQACIIQAHRLLKRKDSPFGVAGANEFGQLMMLRPKLDPDAAVLLESYLRGGVILGV